MRAPGGTIAGRETSARAAAGDLEEHAHGFSSLTLLAGPDPRILYLLNWSTAIFAIRRPDDARSVTIGLDGWDRLPVASGTIDTVVADLDIVPNVHSVGRSVTAELARVLRPGGRCLAVVTHRRRPRDRRAWSRYRLIPPLAGWRTALQKSALTQLTAAALRFDGPRIEDVRLARSAGGARLPAEAADAVALVMTRSSPERAERVEGTQHSSVLETLSGTLADTLGMDVVLNHLLVRKIGKTAAFAGTAGSRVVVRLPVSTIAMARARRNHAALEALHKLETGIPNHVVPRPLAAGSTGSQPYFVEACLPGLPREGDITAVSWDPQALEFITDLHAITARRELLTEAWFQRVVEPALAAIECHTAARDGGAIAWLRKILRERLVGHEVPLVRSHGDFTGGNCLYDRAGRLSGVVDWELSSADALPLLDLVQCVDLPAEYGTEDRWERAELVFEGLSGHGPLGDSPQIRAYLKRLELSADLQYPLLLMHWVDHVGVRVAARRYDERWFRRRVDGPLGRLRQLAQASASRQT